MNPQVKSVIDKLQIVKKLAQAPETQQVCDIVIELAEALIEKEPMGFIASGTKVPNKQK